jgi:mRNA-degrading endonuclease RelE of RelBE toxin-antitoxin system
MDKITKLLKRLSPKARERLEEILALLLSDNASSLDIKKLKGVDGVYRVRTGNLRVIFQKQGKEIRILEVSKRDASTYKNY